MWKIGCNGKKTKMVSSLLSLFMAFWIRVMQPFSCIASFGALEFIQKVGFFICEALWHKVLTVDQLKKGGGGGGGGGGEERSWVWFFANRCFFCLDKEETINHLLIHFPKARTSWELVFSLFGVP